MATHSSILAWRIPGTEEPGGLLSMESHRVGHNWSDLADVFLEFSCIFDDPVDIGKLISGTSGFPKSSLNIWKFTVHVLLKPGLEDFVRYFISMWDECNCVVVWAFLGIAFLWNWNENWSFPVLWPLLIFSKFTGILSAALSQHHLSVFKIARLEFHNLHLLCS